MMPSDYTIDPGLGDEITDDEEEVTFEDSLGRRLPDDDPDDDPDPGIEGDDEDGVHDPGAADPEGDNDSEDEPGASPSELEEVVEDPEVDNARVIRWVRLGDLVLDYEFWTNPRTFTGLDDISLRALAEDILAKSRSTEEAVFAGIDDALKVVRIQDGDRVHELVLDGQRRWKATSLAFAGKAWEGTLVPVLDREPEPVEWSEALAQQYLKEVLTVVGLRAGLSSFELSESALRLHAAKDPAGKPMTNVKIAGVVGRSESWVSKILTARKAAGSKLLDRWRLGEISEEQFRDLATSVVDKQEQEQAADDTAEERKRGNKAGARQSAKERREISLREARARRDKEKAEREAAKEKAKADRAEAKATKAAKKQGKGKKAKGPVVKGPQSDLPLAPEAAKPAAPAKPKALSPAIIEDLIDSSKKRPPTHDLAKGIILGIQVGTGRLDFAELPKQWHRYIEHLSGGGEKAGAKRRR